MFGKIVTSVVCLSFSVTVSSQDLLFSDYENKGNFFQNEHQIIWYSEEGIPALWFDSRLKDEDKPVSAGRYQPSIQIFHESKECPSSAPNTDFCNSGPGMKIFLNPPTISSNDWTPTGLLQAANIPYFTHSSGLFLQSFGKEASIQGVTKIAPSGIHLEPHGSHHGIRVDGTENAGENVRVDVSKGSTGIALYGSNTKSPSCDPAYLNRPCDKTTLLRLQNGMVEYSDVDIKKKLKISENYSMGYSVQNHYTGIEAFTHWHYENQVPVHCVFHNNVDENSVIKITPYNIVGNGVEDNGSYSQELLLTAHTYVVHKVWGAGSIPPECASGQLIKTNAAGTYGAAPPSSSVSSAGGFSVMLLGSSGYLNPGLWGQNRRPTFLYEIISR